jgi:hypothetical protein
MTDTMTTDEKITRDLGFAAIAYARHYNTNKHSGDVGYCTFELCLQILGHFNSEKLPNDIRGMLDREAAS